MQQGSPPLLKANSAHVSSLTLAHVVHVVAQLAVDTHATARHAFFSTLPSQRKGKKPSLAGAVVFELMHAIIHGIDKSRWHPPAARWRHVVFLPFVGGARAKPRFSACLRLSFITLTSSCSLRATWRPKEGANQSSRPAIPNEEFRSLVRRRSTSRLAVFDELQPPHHHCNVIQRISCSCTDRSPSPATRSSIFGGAGEVHLRSSPFPSRPISWCAAPLRTSLGKRVPRSFPPVTSSLASAPRLSRSVAQAAPAHRFR